MTPAPRAAETAIAPITDIALEDITEAANNVDLWLRQLSDNHLTLATLKQAAEYVLIANNIMAAVDAVSDIIALAESEQSDPLDWVSLAINLIGIIPIPPALAFARKSLRPTLHLVRQQLKANPRAPLGNALVTVLAGHMNATILGELENFVTQAQARLPGLLEDCAQSGTAIILALAGGIEDFLSGQLQPSPAIQDEHASLLDTLVRHATLPLEVATVASLNRLSTLLPASTRALGLTYAQRLRRLATEVAPNLRRLANADIPHSIGHLLSMLAQAAKHKRTHLSINIPPTGTKQVRHVTRQQQLGAIGRQRPARQDPGAAKNGACSGTCHSISFARGSEQLVHTDFALPGPFPVTWSRNYRSSQAALDDGPLGARWITPFTVFFQGIENTLRHQAADGRSHDYPLPKVGKFHHDPVEDIVLVRTGERTLSLARGYRLEECYEQVGDRFRLWAIRQRGGACIALHYEHSHQGVQVLSDLLTYQDERLHQHIHTRLDASGRI
uniref:DUF6531 domain-containing protein n=1 Tax=Pseudomonas cremoricolorata TaxID=157783 RepID=UPI00048DFC9A